MTFDKARLADEMAVFADLGTDLPQVRQAGRTLIVRMYRNGEEIQLGFHDLGHGQVVERCGAERRTHASYRALLASERFGDLRRWASTQSMLLRESLADMGRPSARIRVDGTLDSDQRTLGVEELDDLLAPPPPGDSAKVMLIDGPAGIGKTKFIETIASARADAYTKHHRPLILHVQSRGRVLSYLQDLMAFSLQRLRLSVTFDQLPILARHGLVTLAIDGFDELGDPNGYDLAWSQVNETISQLRGQGTLILAGRETFIGMGRLKDALTELGENDAVDGLTLQPPSTAEARRWLSGKKWRAADIKNVSALLETRSYALRPFFLAQLAERDIARSLHDSNGTNLIPILVDVMLQRESGKFGEAVDATLSERERRRYTHRLLSEVARYMADDQTDIIDETSLAWLVEAALEDPDSVDADILALLKNRAGVIAFLTVDGLPSCRRFAHSQLLNYFLSVAAIDALGTRDVPKFVRRNVFSADFVSVFIDVLQHTAREDPERCKRFFDQTIELVGNYQSIDRGARNLGAWLIAALPTIADIVGDGRTFQIGRLDVDETIIKGTLRQARLRHVAVSQLDIRAADLRDVTFENCTVSTAIVDGGTHVSPSFPVPKRLQRQEIGAKYDEWDPDRIRTWLDGHGRTATLDDPTPDPDTRHGRMLRVLERACRSSSFWIPEDTDTKIDRFVKDPLWPNVMGLLDDHGFLHKKKLGVRGANNRFVHIRQADRILANDPEDQEVASFYQAISEAGR